VVHRGQVDDHQRGRVKSTVAVVGPSNMPARASVTTSRRSSRATSRQDPAHGVGGVVRTAAAMSTVGAKQRGHHMGKALAGSGAGGLSVEGQVRALVRSSGRKRAGSAPLAGQGLDQFGLVPPGVTGPSRAGSNRIVPPGAKPQRFAAQRAGQVAVYSPFHVEGHAPTRPLEDGAEQEAFDEGRFLPPADHPQQPAC